MFECADRAMCVPQFVLVSHDTSLYHVRADFMCTKYEGRMYVDGLGPDYSVSVSFCCCRRSSGCRDN